MIYYYILLLCIYYIYTYLCITGHRSETYEVPSAISGLAGWLEVRYLGTKEKFLEIPKEVWSSSFAPINTSFLQKHDILPCGSSSSSLLAKCYCCCFCYCYCYCLTWLGGKREIHSPPAPFCFTPEMR